MAELNSPFPGREITVSSVSFSNRQYPSIRSIMFSAIGTVGTLIDRRYQKENKRGMENKGMLCNDIGFYCRGTHLSGPLYGEVQESFAVALR